MNQIEYIQPPPPLDPALVIATTEPAISKMVDALRGEQWDVAARLGEFVTLMMKVAQIAKERAEGPGLAVEPGGL